ncbi:hypothetical protein BASA81_007582 [Batrachochytrium salamandrivorans]|nr:hypothetical protein BASA81_007582 [Batrachochytrium salamandrivorans]
MLAARRAIANPALRSSVTKRQLSGHGGHGHAEEKESFFIWGGKTALGVSTFVVGSGLWYTKTSSGRDFRKSIGVWMDDDKWDDGLWPGVAACSVVGIVLSTFYWS